VLAKFLGLLLMVWVLTFCRREVTGGGILSRGGTLLPRAWIHWDIGDTLVRLDAL